MATILKTITCSILLVLAISACKKDATLRKKAALLNEAIETNPPVLKAVIKQISDVSGGYYSGLPYHYNETTKNYPLLIFIHGGGQFGDGELDLPLLKNDGVAQLLDAQTFPANFNVNGKNFSFIVLAPQFKRYPSTEEVAFFLNYAKQTFRVDTTRIYMSGLSMGGIITADMGSKYTSSLAAIVPISGVFAGEDTKAKCRNIASGNLPVWVFHNKRDPTINPLNPQMFVEEIRSFNPSVPPILTLFDHYGHDAWTQALNPSYKENNLNIFEWMLQYRK